jgi:hypothetical protein
MRERGCAGLPAIRTVTIRTVILAIRTVILAIRTVDLAIRTVILAIRTVDLAIRTVDLAIRIVDLAIRTVIRDGARACPQILAAHESRRAADGASDELTLLVAQSHCSIGLVFLKQATLGVHDGPQQRINASGACAVPSGTPAANIGCPKWDSGYSHWPSQVGLRLLTLVSSYWRSMPRSMASASSWYR